MIVITALLLLVNAPACAEPSALRAQSSGEETDGEALERASRLRTASETDWAQRRYGEAITKLRAADRIYRDSAGEHLLDRSIVHRAIVWNQVRNGEAASALSTFTDLVKLTAADADLHPQIHSAYRAMYEAAAASADYKVGEQLLARTIHEMCSRDSNSVPGGALRALAPEATP